MIKRYPFFFLIGLTVLLFPALAFAQHTERMLIYSKSGQVFPYRAEHIDSIKFLTEAVDLTLNPQIIPHPSGVTGEMKLSIGPAGEDVQRISVVLPEKYQVEKMTDYQCLRLFDLASSAQTGLQIFEVAKDAEYDLKGLQRGFEYTLLFLPYDKAGCPGDVKRLDFTVPLGELKGNPSIDVKFSDVSATSFKVKFEPNSDTKEYFYLCDETNSTTRDNMMQMFGIPDLKHYVIQLGKDFETHKAHVGTKEQTFDGFKPGTEYTVFVVIVDANGQYSDLYKSFTVKTVSKGTSETANVGIEIKDITKVGATITYTPDVNTAAYRESVIKKGTMTDEEMIAYLRDTPESLQLPFRSDVFTQKWETLDPNTAYYAVALAKNADGKWGSLAKKEFTTQTEQVQVKLPLEYIAEYNVNPEGTAFVSTNATNISGYYSFDEAVEKFTDVTIEGKKYHLPSKEEWLAIVPESESYLRFAKTSKFTDISETVMVGGKSITSTNDYCSTGNNVAYGLRYKGTDFLSAWRYEYTKEGDAQVMKITCRPLNNGNAQISIDEIAKADFWSLNRENDIVRVFPTSGCSLSSKYYDEGKRGYFLSSSAYDSDPSRSWSMGFSNTSANVFNITKRYSFSVRLILSAEDKQNAKYKNVEGMFPSFDFGKSFAKNGPISQWEQARNYKPEYIEDLDYGNYLEAIPNEDAPKTPVKVKTIWYYDTESGEVYNTNYVYSIVTFDEDFPSELGEGETAEIMALAGFTRVPEKDYNSYVTNTKVYVYENRKDMVTIDLNRGMGKKIEMQVRKLVDRPNETTLLHRKRSELLRTKAR